MKAWRKLKPELPGPTPSEVPNNQTNDTIVVISTKEREAMNKMKATLADIGRLLEENVANQSKVKEDTKRISNEIQETFSGYLAKLTERAVTLKKKLSAESKARSDALLQQQETLQKQRESVESGLKDQNEMLTDAKLEGKKREIKMEAITNDLLGATYQEAKAIEVQELVFSHDDDSVSEVGIEYR